jgi:hypothetical protein
LRGKDRQFESLPFAEAAVETSHIIAVLDNIPFLAVECDLFFAILKLSLPFFEAAS